MTANRLCISKAEALRRLTARWLEQSQLFPTMRYELPLHMYVHANLQHVMRYGLLSEYKSKDKHI